MRKVYPRKANDVPVTRKMLYIVRDELKADTRSLERKMDAQFKRVDSRFDKMESRFDKMESRFDKVESRFNEMESRFDEVESRFDEMNSKFNGIDSRFLQIEARLEKMSGDIHRIALLVEEQNAKNTFVLDGLTSLFHRQDRVEARMQRFEKERG